MLVEDEALGQPAESTNSQPAEQAPPKPPEQPQDVPHWGEGTASILRRLAS